MLNESEDSMNCQMSNVTMTAKDGRKTKLEQVYLRGSMITYFILPDILKDAPMFKKVQAMKSKRGGGGGGAGGGPGGGAEGAEAGSTG